MVAGWKGGFPQAPRVWWARFKCADSRRKSGSRCGLLRTVRQDVAKSNKCPGSCRSKADCRARLLSTLWVTHTWQHPAGVWRSWRRGGAGRPLALLRALLDWRVKRPQRQVPTTPSSFSLLLPSFSPPALNSSPTASPSLPRSSSSGLLLPALTRAPGRELVGARGPLAEPSSAEPGGSAARPAAAGGTRARRTRARVGVPSRGPGTFPARPPHSQPRRQPSWFASAALGTGSHRELGTCACSPEVSPGSLGRFPRAGRDCKLQTSATRWAEGLETRRGLRALASWNQVVEAAGGRRGGPRASAARCHLGLGTLARPLSRLPFAPGPAARGLCPAVVCASGLQPR